MALLRQIAATIGLTLSTLPQRRGSASVIVIGMACVVTVLISLQAMTAGFHQMLSLGSRPDRAIVVTKGVVRGTMGSHIQRTEARIIMDTVGVKRDEEGVPIGSGRSNANLDLIKKADGFMSPVSLQGIGPQAMALWPELRIVAGRMYQAGLREFIVGRNIQAQFEGMNVGEHIILPGGDWVVVGVFTTDGGIFDSVIIGDAETLMSALQQADYGAVNVMLNSEADFPQFRDALLANPSLNVDAVRESDYYANLFGDLLTFFQLITFLLGGLMAVGAVFGALNTMYSAVADRQREIGTLRALGFGPTPILISIFVEALLLAVVGALIGVVIAWAAFDGGTRVIGLTVVQLTVNLAVAGDGVSIGVLVALLGSVPPAIRATRLQVVNALRAT